MGMFSRLGSFAGRMFAFNELKGGVGFIRLLAKNLLKQEKVKTPMPDGTIALEMDETIRQKKMRSFLLLMSLSLVGFVFGFVSLAYNLGHHNGASAFVSLAFCLMTVALAFRYHFWWIQLKHKKLGMRFRDWYHALIGKEGQ